MSHDDICSADADVTEAPVRLEPLLAPAEGDNA